MRYEWEAALGRLIANPTALALYQTRPDAFWPQYELTAEEKTTLQNMGESIGRLHTQFTGRRVRRLIRPLPRTLALLGAHGQTLLHRYINLYPAPKTSLAEVNQLAFFLQESLRNLPELPHLNLIQDVLKLERDLHHTLKTAGVYELPAQATEKLARPEEITPQTALKVADGVGYHLYQHNLANVLSQTMADLQALPETATALLVHRPGGGRVIHIVRISPSVIEVLNRCTGTRSLAQIAQELTQTTPDLLEKTIQNVCQLARDMAQREVLVQMI